MCAGENCYPWPTNLSAKDIQYFIKFPVFPSLTFMTLLDNLGVFKL